MESGLTTLLKKLEKKGQKEFAQCPKRIKSTYVLQKFVFPQTVLMDKENAVFTTPPKVCRKRPEISCSKSQIDTKIQKVHFPSYCPYGQVENSLDNIAERFPMKSRTYLAQCPKIIWNFQFCRKKNVFCKLFLWRRRVEFWHRRKFSAKGPKIFAQGPKKLRKHRFLKKMFFGNCSFGHVEYSVGIPSKNYSKKSQKVFAQCAKIIGET